MSDPIRFSIGFTQKAEFQLAVLLRRATIFGVSGRVEAALKVILDRLRTDARDWGEPAYTLKGMKTVMRVGFHDRIRFNYAVHESQPGLFVHNIEAEPGHPLFRPPG